MSAAEAFFAAIGGGGGSCHACRAWITWRSNLQRRTIRGVIGMADIAPFQAIRYDFAALGGVISDRIAPPYDVLDQADKERFLARCDRNIVAIDLPHAPAKAVGPAHCYEQAGGTMREWLEDGTMVRESSPAVYVYRQRFQANGADHTRNMVIVRLKLELFSAGTVLPHEETFGGPKEDRLALMKATHANVSSVLGLYRDPQGRVDAITDGCVERQPDATGELDGVRNDLWVVPDADVIGAMVDFFAGKKCYIADGHHRYNTALNYRDWVAQQLGGVLPENHPADYVMVVLASMDDPGNLILPTHRVMVQVGDLTLDRLLAAWDAGCERSDSSDADVTVFHGATGETVSLKFTNRRVLETLEPSKSDAWRSLDVAYLHRYLIDELFVAFSASSASPSIRYLKSERDAQSVAVEEKGIAVICNATTMAQLRDVSEAGDLMPQKSTYFYPKVATGLTVNSLQ